MKTIDFYVIDNDEKTNEMECLLTAQGVRVVVRGCPRSAGEWLEFPFVCESSGSLFCGEQGIRAYISKLERNRKHTHENN